MALFIPGGALGGGTISGKQGSIVFSHNKGGAYIRNRVVPVDPQSQWQQLQRNWMSQFVSRWHNVLTQAERDAWETYAANVPRVNRIGLPHHLTGINWYVAMNTFRIQGGRTIVDTAPGTFIMSSYTMLTSLVASEAAQTVSVVFDNTETWADDEGCMNIYLSRPQNVTRNFFKGPYRHADTIVGNTATPPTSPYAAATAFAFVQGQRIFLRANVCEASGIIGTASHYSVIAGA